MKNISLKAKIFVGIILFFLLLSLWLNYEWYRIITSTLIGHCNPADEEFNRECVEQWGNFVDKERGKFLIRNIAIITFYMIVFYVFKKYRYPKYFK